MTGPYAIFEVPGNWAMRAACIGRGDEFVMPGLNKPAHAARMKQVCAGCEVLDECRTWALSRPDPALGLIAGGMTPKERKTEAKRLGIVTHVRPPIRHGTVAGAATHRRRGERPCAQCLAAAAAYQQAYKEARP